MASTANTVQIPTGWNLTKLGEVLAQNDCGERLSGAKLYRLLGVRLAGQGPFLREEKLGQQIQASHLSKVHAGNFIYSRLFAWRGAFGVIPEELDGAYVSNEFPTFSVDRSQLDVDFLRLYFSQPPVWSEVETYCTGTTKASRNRFKEEFFLGMKIPLPPPDEQGRIVCRVEKLAAKVEEAWHLRRNVNSQTDKLVSAASASIFDNPSWPYKTIESLVGRANLKNGLSVKSDGVGSSARCLRLSAMRDGRIDFRDSKPVPLTETQAMPYLVHEGDVFIMRGNGSKELVGRAGLVVEDCTGVIFPDLLIRVPLKNSELLGSFFTAVWNSHTNRNVIEDLAKTTSGIWKINQGHIAAVSIPVPPLEEQRRIVAYLDDLQAKVDNLKKLQSETARELDALMPSILSRAFRGDL